jgi:hypothetical protein
MMKRHNQILAGILIVQIVLSIVIFWPKSTASAESEPIFPDLESDDIVAVTIADAADIADIERASEENSIRLAKTNGEWVLPNADDYPAQESQITSLLEKFVALTTGRLVTRTDASHKRLQVASDDFVRRITFETADGTEHTLYLGSSPRYGATHFRLEGQSETYLTDEISTWDTNATADSWIDAAYVSIPQADVASMVLENQHGTLTFRRVAADADVDRASTDVASDDTGGQWTMDGLAEDETLAETKITAVVRQAATLNMIRPLGKEEKAEYGMDEPNAVVTLETLETEDADVDRASAASRTVTLYIGAQDPSDNSYVVISSESPYYVRVSELSVKGLVENTREDFLDVPATSTPEGEMDSS